MSWLVILPVIKYVVPFVVGWFTPRPQDLWSRRIEAVTDAVEEIAKSIK